MTIMQTYVKVSASVTRSHSYTSVMQQLSCRKHFWNLFIRIEYILKNKK